MIVAQINSSRLLKKMHVLKMLLRSCLNNLYQCSWCLLEKMRLIRSYLADRKEVEVEEEDSRDQFLCWHQLPLDMLEKIVLQSDLVDSVRMSAVCKTWNVIVKESNRAQVVWLMLNHDMNNRKLLRFFDVCEGRFYDFKLPKNLRGGYWCCGSSKGWLAVLMMNDSESNPKMFLYNPLSGIQLPLPSLTSVPSFVPFRNSMKNFNNVAEFIGKIELSSVDAAAKNCVVAATFPQGIVALCRPADKRWAILEGIIIGDDEIVSDILFCNGELHVLISAATAVARNTTDIIKVKVGDDHDIVVKLIPDNCTSILENPQTSWDPKDESESLWILREALIASRLVESDGELLIVHKAYNILKAFLKDEVEEGEEEEEEDEDDLDEDDCPQFNYFQVNRIEVLKTDLPITSTSTMRLKPSLGDRMLFVSRSCSLSLPATEKGLRKNCIYFLSDLDYINVNDFDLYVSRESGVYCLEDDSIQRIFPSTKDSLHCRTSWFCPNIM